MIRKEPSLLGQFGAHKCGDGCLHRVTWVEHLAEYLGPRVDTADYVVPGVDVVSSGLLCGSRKTRQMSRLELVIVIEECDPWGFYPFERSLPRDSCTTPSHVLLDDHIYGRKGLLLHRGESPVEE